MPTQISEADWKRFRKLQPLALDRFCARVLAELGQIAADPQQTHHQRYLAVFALMQRRDRELADTFDGTRRSNALFQIMRLRVMGLMTDDEFAAFSPETRAAADPITDE